MFGKHRSRIRLKLNFMDVINIHEVEFKDNATAVILRGSLFLVPCLRQKYSKNKTKCLFFLFVLCLRCSYRKD